MTNSLSAEELLVKALRESQDSDAGVRLGAVVVLGSLIDQRPAFLRLVEMLRDEIVTVGVDATEMLARYGGTPGILAVLEVLGAEVDDPDYDYLAYKLQELEGMGEVAVLETADSIDPTALSADAALGLRNLHALIRPEPRNWS